MVFHFHFRRMGAGSGENAISVVLYAVRAVCGACVADVKVNDLSSGCKCKFRRTVKAMLPDIILDIFRYYALKAFAVFQLAADQCA